MYIQKLSLYSQDSTLTFCSFSKETKRNKRRKGGLLNGITKYNNSCDTSTILNFFSWCIFSLSWWRQHRYSSTNVFFQALRKDASYFTKQIRMSEKPIREWGQSFPKIRDNCFQIMYETRQCNFLTKKKWREKPTGITTHKMNVA